MGRSKWLVIALVLLGIVPSFGQIQSIKSGNWDDPTVWSSGTVPNSSSAAITVRHTVHVRSAVYSSASPLVIDGTTVGANGFSGYLIVDGGAFLQVANGAGTDLAFAGIPTVGKVDVSGRLSLATGTALTGNTTSNLNFLAGGTYEHQYVSAATALPAATYNSASTILINGFTGTGAFSASWNVPVGNVVYNCPAQAAGVVNFAGFLRQIQGSLDVQNTGATGRIAFNTSGTSTIASSSAVVIGGQLSISGLSRVWLTSTGTVEVYVGGGLTFSPNAAAGTSQSATSGIGTLQIAGNATLSSGTWNFASANNGRGVFDLRGSLSTTGATLTETGGGTSQGNLNFNGTSGQQNFDGSGLAATTINVAVNNAAGIKILNSMVLSGTMTLTNGNVVLPGTSLTLNGPIVQTAGAFTNDVATTPTLRIAGTGSVPANFSILNGSTFSTFEMNRASTTLTSSSNFSLQRLNLYAGTFTNNGTVTMTNGGLVDRQATSAANTGVLSKTLSAAGTYDVQYTNTVPLSPGPELPTSAAPGVLKNLTKAGSNTLTLNNNLTINGSLSVTTGTLTDGGTARVVNLMGNFSSGGTASSLGSTNFTFASGASPSTFSGAIAPVFGTLNFLHNVTVSVNFRINGNLTVGSGAVVSGTSGIASFGGTTAVTNNGTLNLNAVTILANSSLTAPASTLGIAGNFIITNATSTFTNNTGTLLFNGSTAVSGTGTKTFNNITVSGTMTTAVSLRVNGNIINNGTINFTAGTLTFGGAAGTLMGSTPTSTTFFTTTIAAGSKMTSSVPFRSNGVFTINGTAVCNSSFTLASSMSVASTGTLTANSSPFSVAGTLTVATPGSCIANPGADAVLSGNVTVTGTFTSLSKTTIAGSITLTGAGAKSWKDVVITGTLTPNANYTITGNLSLTGTGTLNAGNSTTTFGGTTVFSNSGTGNATLNNVTISAGSSLTANSNLTLNSTAFTGTGSYTSTATTLFARAGTTTLTGAGLKKFNNLTINAGTTVTPNAAYTVTGNISATGILGAGNNTATFDGSTAISITAPGTVNFNSLVINATRSLTSAPGSITVNGNFTDNGNFLANNGTVIFAGNTANRMVNGTSVTPFNNITINNGTQATDLSVETNKDLFGVLTMAANSRMDPDGASNAAIFTLRSSSDSPASDASIAALPSPALAPAQINGSITVQRYMSAEGRIYRYISSPVQGATVASWKDNFPITGTFSDPSNPGVVCGKTVKPTTASLFLYNEAALPAGAYVAYPTAGTAASNALTVGRGYATFIRECSVPTVIDTRGTLVNTVNMGTVNLPVTFTAASSGHYNLVGNPYPSAIDWDNFTTRTRVSGTIAIRDNGTGVFHYWTNTTLGTNGFGDIPRGVIAQGQAFWVTSTAAAPALQLTESAKVASPASSGNIFFRELNQDPDLLQITVAGSTQTQTDKAYIYQLPQATVGLDSIDGPKLDNYVDDPYVQLFDLYTTAGTAGQAMAVNALPSITCGSTINLVLRDAKVGTYSYSFNKSGAISDLIVHLYDKFTGQSTMVSEGSRYSFSITSDVASQAADRFALSFSDTPVNLDLPVDGDSKVCGDASAVVVLKNSQLGVAYSAVLNNVPFGDAIQGTGSDIKFPISNAQLVNGTNQVTLKAVSACSAMPLNNSFTIRKDSLITARTTSASHCQEGSVSLKASGALLSGSYRWYSASDTTSAIVGETSDTFVTPVLSKTKKYFVSIVNGNGCEGIKVPVTAEIVSYDNAVVTATGTAPNVQLQSNAQAGNQWYFNGEVIAGATASVYSASSPGNYILQVTTGNCTSSSDPYRIDVVAGIKGEDSNLPEVTLSPNPVAGVLTVRVQTADMPSVRIYNVTGAEVGQVITQGDSFQWTGRFDFSAFPHGVYVIHIMNGQKNSSYRVVKE